MSPVAIFKEGDTLFTLPDKTKGQVDLGERWWVNVRPRKNRQVGLELSRVFQDGPLRHPPKPKYNVGYNTLNSPLKLYDASEVCRFSARYVPPDPQARNPRR